MNCPFCRIASMRTVRAGDHEIDRCATCGALWFDLGEIRELTEGRVPFAGEDAEAASRSAPEAPAGGRPERPGHGSGGLLLSMHRGARTLGCPRCGGKLGAVDFQTTGIPVFLCRDCRGYLAPRASAAAIHARFLFYRAHQGEYAALGEAITGAFGRRPEGEGGAVPRGSAAQIPLPILVPLGADSPAPKSLPIVTYLLIALSVGLDLHFRISGAAPRLPGGVPGLPPGIGLGAVPAAAILFSPFVHGGIVPLLVGTLFLFVLGGSVEDRIGRLPFLALYLLGGVAAGVAHLALGDAGHAAALGSAGAVAGVLGAYVIFFPQVSITMYGLGRLISVPAYLFACAWIVAAFLIGPGPLMNLFNPAPLSLAGNVAGFGSGVFGGVCWRLLEESIEK